MHKHTFVFSAGLVRGQQPRRRLVLQRKGSFHKFQRTCMLRWRRESPRTWRNGRGLLSTGRGKCTRRTGSLEAEVRLMEWKTMFDLVVSEAGTVCNWCIFILGWEKHYSGLSDSDLPSMRHDPLESNYPHAHRLHHRPRRHLSPDKDVLGDFGDSDMESIASVTSSALSTQSERPRGSRGRMWVPELWSSAFRAYSFSLSLSLSIGEKIKLSFRMKSKLFFKNCTFKPVRVLAMSKSISKLNGHDLMGLSPHRSTNP